MAVELETLETKFVGNDRDLKRAFREGERASQQFARNVRRDLGSVSSAMSSPGGGFKGDGLLGQLSEGLKMIPGIGVLAKAVASVTDKLVDGVKLGIDYNRVIEESRLSFTRFFGSAKLADDFIGKLQQLRREGIALDEAAAASRRFLAARFDKEQIPAYIAAVGDAARFTGAEVDAITRALTQMASKGQVSAEEVNQQLAEQGIPAWRYIAEQIALEDREFAKLTTDRQIREAQIRAERNQLSGMGGAQAVLRGIQRDFGGFSREYAEKTATGLEDQLLGAIKRQLGTAEGPLFQRYKGLLKGTLDTVNSEAVSALARGVAGQSGTAFNALDEALKQGGNIGSGLMQGVAGKGFEAAKGFLKEFADGIGSHSPATEFIPLGVSAAEGFKIGFSKEMAAGGGVMGLFQGGRGPLGEGVGRYGDLIERIAREVGIDPNLIRAVMQQESGGRRYATSGAGAQGLMQLMPATARRFGVSNPFDPEQSIRGGAQYLKWLSERYGGDLTKILAGYNAGEGNVDRYNGVPPFRETQNYVRSVQGIYGQLGGALSGTLDPNRILDPFTNQPVDLRTIAAQQQVLLQMMRQMGLGRGYQTGGDLAGGTGQFAGGDPWAGVNFAQLDAAMWGGSARRLNRPIGDFGSLDISPGPPLAGVELPDPNQVWLKFGLEIENSTEKVEDLNNEIRQTVPILQKAQEEASLFGITAKGAGEAFEDAWVGAFTRTDGGFKGMTANMLLYFTQSLNQMVQQWAAAQVRMGLSKFLSWGLGALFGGAASGAGGGVASNGAIWERGGVNVGGMTLGPPRIGFATGGSFMVGGPAGVDRTPVYFMASRGEKVTVETPGQQRTVRPPVQIHYAPVFYANPQTGRFSRQSAEQAARVQLDILNHVMERGG